MSTAGLAPASGMTAPREISSVVFISRPAVFAAAPKFAADFSVGARPFAAAFAASTAFFWMMSLRTRSFTASSTGSVDGCLPVTVMNTKPCAVRSGSLTSPSFSVNASDATCGDGPRSAIGSSRRKKPLSFVTRPLALATRSKSAGVFSSDATRVEISRGARLGAFPLQPLDDLRPHVGRADARPRRAFRPA